MGGDPGERRRPWRTSGPHRATLVARATRLVRGAHRRSEGVLGELGHDVRVAADGRAALVVIQDFTPEIGILDIGLPEMDGYELAASFARLSGGSLDIVHRVRSTRRPRAQPGGCWK